MSDQRNAMTSTIASTTANTLPSTAGITHGGRGAGTTLKSGSGPAAANA
jgi:hypothetical protein